MNISTKLQRIAKMAREHPTRAFTNLAHYIDLDFLREAFRLTRKDGAPGVDGILGETYEKNLEVNLQSLLDRFKSGTYRAPDVRRVHIPKGKEKTRPLGIPTFEDKVLQRAVAMILEAVYEQCQAGLLALFLWISPRALCPPSAYQDSIGVDEHERWMGRRSRHQRLLRCFRARVDTEDPEPTDT